MNQITKCLNLCSIALIIHNHDVWIFFFSIERFGHATHRQKRCAEKFEKPWSLEVIHWLFNLLEFHKEISKMRYGIWNLICLNIYLIHTNIMLFVFRYVNFFIGFLCLQIHNNLFKILLFYFSCCKICLDWNWSLKLV